MVPSRARDLRRNLFSRAEAGIDQARRLQFCQRRRVIGEMLRLAAHRFFPGDSQPAQIVEDRALEFGAAARRIDVFDAQQKAPAAGPRRLIGAERGKGVAEVEKSGWTWREAGDNHGPENLHRKTPA